MQIRTTDPGSWNIFNFNNGVHEVPDAANEESKITANLNGQYAGQESAHDAFAAIIETARRHYENLKTDISNAKDRIEHIRLTALAQEAHKLLTDLELFEIGMIYTRVMSLGETDLKNYMQVVQQSRAERAELEGTTPEFKSPFTPPAG